MVDVLKRTAAAAAPLGNTSDCMQIQAPGDANVFIVINAGQSFHYGSVIELHILSVRPNRYSMHHGQLA